MQLGRRVGGEPDHVAGVGRNLRVDEDDGEHGRGAACTRSTTRRHVSASRRCAGGSVRATTQPRRRRAPARRHAPRGRGERGAGGHHVVDERDALARERRGRQRTRRGRCAPRSAHGSAACGGESRVRRKPGDQRHARCARATRRAISRAWLKPRSRWRAGASGSATSASGRRALPRRVRRARDQRRGERLGEREPAAVLECVQQAVDRKRVDAKAAIVARTAAAGARHAPQAATVGAGSAQTRARGRQARQCRAARGAQRARRRWRCAERARLRQRAPQQRADRRAARVASQCAARDAALSNFNAAKFDKLGSSTLRRDTRSRSSMRRAASALPPSAVRDDVCR